MDFNRVVSSYTAGEAESDGFLHNVGDIAREAGFKWPVRITSGVLGVVNPSTVAKEYGQSYEGRLWDVLNIARVAVIQSTDDPPLVEFDVLFWNSPTDQRTVKLWAVIDTTSDPAIHIMLPKES